jgi:hypothetical protein
MCPSRAWSLLVFVLLAGCTGSAARVREYTYPPRFEYIEPERLHSAMWRLAFEVKELDRTLRDPQADSAAQQRLVSTILQRMDDAARGIATPGRITQHPLLNRNLSTFRDQVVRAQADVERMPPSYFNATALVGSCAACHGSVTAGAGS